MEFKAEVNLEYKDFLAWNKLYSKTGGKKNNTVNKILLIVVSIAMLLCVGFLIVFDTFDTTVAICAVIYVIAFITILFKNRINAKATQKNYMKNLGTEYLVFTDEAIFTSHSKAESKFFYGGFYDFYSDGDRFFLLLDDRHTQIVPTRCFVEGDPTAFPAFFTEKTGLEMKIIKC